MQFWLYSHFSFHNLMYTFHCLVQCTPWKMNQKHTSHQITWHFEELVCVWWGVWRVQNFEPDLLTDKQYFYFVKNILPGLLWSLFTESEKVTASLLWAQMIIFSGFLLWCWATALFSCRLWLYSMCFFFFLLDGFPFFLTGAVHFSILTFILITWVYFFTFRGCAWSWVMTALGAPHWDFQGNSNTLWCRRIAWLLIIETQNQDRK